MHAAGKVSEKSVLKAQNEPDSPKFKTPFSQTDEAKADLGRLAEIRKRRELDAARRKAETEAKDAANKVALEKSGKKIPTKK